MLRREFVAVILAVVSGSCAGALPSVVRDEMASSPHGTATIVFFTDFQCPFCRRTHAALAPVLASAARRDHVRLVLRHVPLPSHPYARGAARASVCGEALGASAGLDDALFASPDLTEAACEAVASQYGVDRDAYRRCVASPETAARIDRDMATFDATGGEGVPLLFIGAQRFEGEQSPETLAIAVDDAVAAASR